LTATRTHEQGAAKTWPKKYKAGTPARTGRQATRITPLEYQLELVEGGVTARITAKLRPAVLFRKLGCVEAGWPAGILTMLETTLKYV
jgi:hypothetical protein